jgi:hypothetical protein
MPCACSRSSEPIKFLPPDSAGLAVLAAGAAASAQVTEGFPDACFAWYRRQKEFITGLIHAASVTLCSAQRGQTMRSTANTFLSTWSRRRRAAGN